MSLSTLPVVARWGVLIALSVLFAALLTWARLPAALLLGSMLPASSSKWRSGILVPQLPWLRVSSRRLHDSSRSYSTIIHSFLHQWPLFLGISLLVIVAVLRVGLDYQQVPHFAGDDGHLGLLPGAASAMMVMADAYGADARLVVFMQYVRVHGRSRRFHYCPFLGLPTGGAPQRLRSGLRRSTHRLS